MTHAEAWLDEMIGALMRHRPVSATFIGAHEHDARLPDYSDAGLAAAHGDCVTLLARLRALPAERLGGALAADLRLAAGQLRIWQWELGSAQYVYENPAVYTGEAIFGLVSLLRAPFAPLPERAALAAERLRAVPALLAQGRANLRAAPPAWLERGLAECDAGAALLGDGVAQLLAAHPGELAPHADELRRAAAVAADALGRFRSFLADELRWRPGAEEGCGPDALDLLLREAHCLAGGAEAIERQAEAAIAEAQGALEAGARALGAPSWQAALAALADDHPSAEGYYARYAELWEACRALAVERDLLSWPDFPIRYLPQPAWARAAAPGLYFLFYHAPASLDMPQSHDYLVTPVEPDMPPEEQLRRLRAASHSTIKLNHVVHHGAIGHHVQNWHAMRAESRIGRIAAVDCAMRIALPCGGTMAEGWACYATDLMAEAGFLTPLELLAEQHTRLRMAARALVDIRLHSGRLSVDGAAALYQQVAGLPAAAARAEATRNSMVPGSALIYMAGTDAIHALRRELAARPGFSLRRFHDRLLAHGSLPVALIAEQMRAGGADAE